MHPSHYARSAQEASLAGMKSALEDMGGLAFPVTGLSHENGSTGGRAGTASDIVSIIDSVLDLLGEQDNNEIFLAAAPTTKNHLLQQPEARQ